MTKNFYKVVCIDYNELGTEYHLEATKYFLNLKDAQKYINSVEERGVIALIRDASFQDGVE